MPVKPPPSAEKTGAAGSAASYLDPATLMRIKNLQLRARLVVQGFMSGLHRSPYHGFSVEFTEYRQYTPGDDLRFLDWRLYARSDRYYLKRFEDETNLRCYLLVDLSRSMAYGSLAYTKAEYAKTAAATLAYFMALQRDAVGLVTFDAGLQEYLPARFRPGHLHRLLMALERSPGGTGTDVTVPLDQIAKSSHKRGLVILLSDLLAPVEALETHLGYLRAQGHDVCLLRTLDPAEIEFPFEQAAQFLDLETGRELFVDPELVRQRYLERFGAHAQSLRTACQKLGVDYFELVTNQPLELALFDLLNSRMRRGRQVARKPGLGRRGVSAGGGA